MVNIECTTLYSTNFHISFFVEFFETKYIIIDLYFT